MRQQHEIRPTRVGQAAAADSRVGVEPANLGTGLPMLAAQRELIAVDLPGFGETPALRDKVTIASLTDAVESFIAEHNLGAVDVVGSSMGARMALELARRGHAGSVVALDPGGFWTDRQVKIFHATIGSSIALVRRIQPLLPALSRSRAGRTALLLQFSAKPWRLPPDLVLRELRSIARSPGTDAAFHAWFTAPNSKALRPPRSRVGSPIGWGRNDRVTAASQAQRACSSSRMRRCTGSPAAAIFRTGTNRTMRPG